MFMSQLFDVHKANVHQVFYASLIFVFEEKHFFPRYVKYWLDLSQNTGMPWDNISLRTHCCCRGRQK